MELYFKNPAKCWLEGFPLGNGRMGAVIHGALDHEVLQLNEDTLWSGSPYSGQTGLSPEVVNQARELARAGKYEEAKLVMEKKLRMYRFICPLGICFWILWRIIMMLMEVQLQVLRQIQIQQ